MQPILNLILQNKFASLIVIICISVLGYIYFWYTGITNDLMYWKNEAAKQTEILQVSKNQYEIQALELEKIKLLNSELKNRISETGREIMAYQKLILLYERELGKIPTTGDTVVLKDTIYIKDTTGNRYFTKWFDNEVFLQGYFQTKYPFDLYVSKLSMIFSPEIVLSQSDDETWFANLETNSQYLKPSMFHVEIKPRSKPFEWFAGAQIITNKTKEFDGVGVLGGIKKGHYGLVTSCSVSATNDYQLSLGVLYFNEF